MAIVALFFGSLLGLGTAGAVALTGATFGTIVMTYLVSGLLTASLFLAQGMVSRNDF